MELIGLFIAFFVGVAFGSDSDEVNALKIRNAVLETELRLLRERLGLPDNNNDQEVKAK